MSLCNKNSSLVQLQIFEFVFEDIRGSDNQFSVSNKLNLFRTSLFVHAGYCIIEGI